MIEAEPTNTLTSPEFRVWQQTALASGMPEADIAAVARIRLRLIAAVTLCEEIIGTTPVSLVAEVFHETCSDLDRSEPYQLEWPTHP